jgi:1-acyl-sn-glycerol-3-phosphate acyltransferase
VRDLTYPPIIATAKVAFKLLGLRFDVRGAEHVPRSGGALLVFNHVSYIDFILGGLAAVPSGRVVRFMAKREVFDHRWTGPVMRSMHHIAVDRADGVASYDEAVRYLREGEIVGIFPEATISRSFELKEFKTGATRMAAEAGVPLVPVILWGTQRIKTKGHPQDFSRGKTIAITVGEPIRPVGTSSVADTGDLKSTMARMLDETIRRYPPEEQPPGSWWLPAAYGGSAPTMEEAAELEAEERRDRARRRAARRAARKG